MIRQIVLWCAISLAGVSAAHAQTPAAQVPEDLRAAGEAVLDYAGDVPVPRLSTVFYVSVQLNGSESDLRAAIVKDRAAIAEATATLAALKLPVSKVKGFDLSFAVKPMRDGAKANLATASHAVDTFETMVNALKAGDCAGYAAGADALKKSRMELLSFSKVDDIKSIQQFLARFAGWDPNRTLKQVAIVLSPDARMKTLAAELAMPLRCPQVKDTFEIEAEIPFLASGGVGGEINAYVRVTSELEASKRADIEARFKDFAVPGDYRFSGWKDAKTRMRFRWDGSALQPVPE